MSELEKRIRSRLNEKEYPMWQEAKQPGAKHAVHNRIIALKWVLSQIREIEQIITRP